MSTKSSIVLELQRDALDRSIKVSDLLRKALVVARKIKAKSFEEWIKRELNGYATVAETPSYRMVRGEVKARNPYHGWQPVAFEDPKQAEGWSTQANGSPIAELEAITEQRSKDSVLGMSMSPEFQAELPLPVALIVSAATLSGIIDVVRTAVLNWSLQLEEDGIVGEGLTFSAAEQSKAAGHSYNVNNFFGPVAGSSFQQGTQQTMQAESLNIAGGLFVGMRHSLGGALLAGPERNAVLARLDALEKAKGTPSFLERYTEFMAAAADHVTVLTPYLPALAQLLIR